METKAPLGRRTLSLSIENSLNTSITAKHREITNAIHSRNPTSLLSMSFTRASMSPVRPSEEKADSSAHLLMLKKTIDLQRLSSGRGDKTVSTLRQELKKLELEDTKYEFWSRQTSLKVKQLQFSIEEAVRRQAEEINNREIYNHLLKRMKKTKIFLEIRSGVLNTRLENSDIVLGIEKHKYLISKEAAAQAVDVFKDFKKSVDKEKSDAQVQIFGLETSISKNRQDTDRRENWKKHQETMYEAAVIEDRSAKNLRLKEGLSLHRLWYNILTKIFDHKREKSKKLEEAFQQIKIATGVPEIGSIVENFLTKEQTYDALMKTVSTKEVECSDYKKKIDEIQRKVNNSSNKDPNDGNSLGEMKDLQQKKIRELMELSNKKFVIENIHSKVRSWLRLMIRKFNKTMGQPGEVLDDKDLLFYVRNIKEIFSLATNDKKLGEKVEANRKYAVISLINRLSKEPHTIAIEEIFNENSLIGTEGDEEKGRY